MGTYLMESSDILFTWPTLAIYLIRVLLENTKDLWFGVLLSMQTLGGTHSWSAHTLSITGLKDTMSS